MIFAEYKIETLDAEDGYYTKRFFVYNGDNMIGSYGVHYSPRGAYGASRDYHALATEEQAAAYERWLVADESDKYDFDSVHYLHYASNYNHCVYHGDKLSICDGSSLVEVTDSEQRGFEIAAMMAEVER